MQQINLQRFKLTLSKSYDYLINLTDNVNLLIHRFEASFGQQTVIMSFKQQLMTDLNNQQLTRVSRKGNRMEIIV